ncbi:MAG: Phosphatidylserine decarboxylase-related [Myxococcaceae bacterium]|nr:Phosphatidylserine decarboxylase-related [Myxococcaceae bacterium]
MRPNRVGEWLPADQKAVESWLSNLIDEVQSNEQPLHPVIDELRLLIEDDAQVYMLFHQMFDELPDRPRFFRSPLGTPQVRDYRLMLKLLNAAITRAPKFGKSMVALPINAILDWPLGTGAGASAFLNPKVNTQFHKILDQWARYLGSPESVSVLNEDPHEGWFGHDAMKAMPNFDEEFICDPGAPHRGFKSWDAFFTREFRPGRRPIAVPDDDRVIVNPCESAPYRLADGVKERDCFWVKSQPYSLIHMLANDPLARQFIGGTVYQSFLNALSYHRWHSPVTGKIVKAYRQPGSYYAQAHTEGLDREGVHDSQAYLTEVATRAMLFIEADNPDIGLMCFLAVGMGEVSTCEIQVTEGQRVKKGEQLGMFHYGGSTQCLIFRPGVRLTFDLHGQKPGTKTENILVNARLATVG